MPGPNLALSTLDGELLTLTMSTHATPLFTLTDSASQAEISALDRAALLELQTHQQCPPRGISLWNRTCPPSPGARKPFGICTYEITSPEVL